MGIMNKFPSFGYILDNARASFGRFTLALLCAFAATLSGTILIEENLGPLKFILEKLGVVAGLGLPLFIAIVFLWEKRKWNIGSLIVAQLIGVLLLIAYYLSLPEDISRAYVYFTRTFLLFIGLHFLVSFIPFWGGKQVADFWQFNKALFLRFLLAALYSGVLYVGLAIALAAAEHLFGLDIKEIRYPQLWVITVGIFNTWVFLAGIPENLDKMTADVEYPKGLKIFTQYILLPLVGLYFLILITYEGKILFTWDWPKGWVGHLVLWYSVVGILSMLLLHPLKEQSENRWIKVFNKWFYIALVPLLVMLFIAIIKRISEYGVTENRYFVFVMAVGLAIVVFYFIFNKIKDIRIIPIVLCCLAFLSSFGPWGAFSVSEDSQRSRLEKLMINNNILIDGKIQKAPEIPDVEDRNEMSSITSYLHDFHGLKTFSDWLPDSTLKNIDTLSEYSQSAEITQMMGFEYIYDIIGKRFFSYSLDKSTAIGLEDYDYLINFSLTGESEYETNYQLNNYSCFIKFIPEQTALQIRFGGTYLTGDDKFKINLADLLLKLKGGNSKLDLPIDKLSFVLNENDFKIRVIFNNVIGTKSRDKADISSLSGILLIKNK